MRVSIKELASTMELKTKGMTLDVYDNDDTFLGDLRIGKATIEWCKGKTHKGHGSQRTWKELIAWFEE